VEAAVTKWCVYLCVYVFVCAREREKERHGLLMEPLTLVHSRDLHKLSLVFTFPRRIHYTLQHQRALTWSVHLKARSSFVGWNTSVPKALHIVKIQTGRLTSISYYKVCIYIVLRKLYQSRSGACFSIPMYMCFSLYAADGVRGKSR
jgi:hypothetical protein